MFRNHSLVMESKDPRHKISQPNIMTKGHSFDTDKGAKPLNGEHPDDVESGFKDGVHVGFISHEQNVNDTLSDDVVRHTWSRKIEYILTMVGYCVGLGNVCRFPYVCIRNGGGAFLIPFLICLVFCGMPLFFLEVTLGQFQGKGPVHAWTLCPLFKGLGISMVVLSLIVVWYQGMMLAWTLLYTAHSFRSPLPWTRCDGDWNTPLCVLLGDDRFRGGWNHSGSFNTSLVNLGLNTTSQNVGYDGWDNSTISVDKSGQSASEEFWIYNILQLSSGLETTGDMLWTNVAALLVTSVVVLGCIIRGVRSVGKVVYVTALLPYVLLTILIIKGATLPGALEGVLFYFRPDFSKLGQVSTWVEASVQVFYSLGPCWGGIITMASYNKFNNNCLRDAVFLSFCCEGTSVFAGFAIFTVLGHMAYNLNVTVDTFTSTGPGLVFVVYPEAISYLPVPQLWGIIFFFMLFIIGLDSQFASIETCLTTIQDMWPKLVNRYEMLVKIVYTVILFLVTLPFAAQGGMYFFQLVDWYVAAFTVAFNGILECIVVGWIYGAERLLDDLQLMIGKKPPYMFAVMWRFVTPTILAAVLVSTLLTYAPPTYEGYTYGPAGIFFGWCIAVVSFVPIPLYAAYKLSKTQGSFFTRLKTTCTPEEEWRPSDVSLREEYKINNKYASLCTFRLPCRRL